MPVSPLRGILIRKFTGRAKARKYLLDPLSSNWIIWMHLLSFTWDLKFRHDSISSFVISVYQTVFGVFPPETCDLVVTGEIVHGVLQLPERQKTPDICWVDTSCQEQNNEKSPGLNSLSVRVYKCLWSFYDVRQEHMDQRTLPLNCQSWCYYHNKESLGD